MKTIQPKSHAPGPWEINSDSEDQWSWKRFKFMYYGEISKP